MDKMSSLVSSSVFNEVKALFCVKAALSMVLSALSASIKRAAELVGSREKRATGATTVDVRTAVAPIMCAIIGVAAALYLAVAFVVLFVGEAVA